MKSRLVVSGAMAAARLVELRRSRENLRRVGDADEGRWSRATFPLMVLLHGCVLVATAVRGRDRASWWWLALLLGVQPLRMWVLRSLGPAWNARGAVPSDLEVVTRGPYAWVRHPNYLVVVVELLALPMAFGMRRLALAATVANATLLAVRIRDEESRLMRHGDYRAWFADKPRFFPWPSSVIGPREAR